MYKVTFRKKFKILKLKTTKFINVIGFEQFNNYLSILTLKCWKKWLKIILIFQRKIFSGETYEHTCERVLLLFIL